MVGWVRAWFAGMMGWVRAWFAGMMGWVRMGLTDGGWVGLECGSQRWWIGLGWD